MFGEAFRQVGNQGVAILRPSFAALQRLHDFSTNQPINQHHFVINGVQDTPAPRLHNKRNTLKQ